MRTNLVTVLVLCLLVPPVLAGPREWSDDFTTVATYDSAALMAPCYGGSSTKYSSTEAFTGAIANERTVSGNGRLRFSNKDNSEFIAGSGRAEFNIIGALNVGQPCPDVSGLGFLESTALFTSTELCMYGGFSYKPVELLSAGTLYGPDGQPGVANVDDDSDGETDEADENPFRAPIGGTGYGPPFPGGVDARPGVANVDDDGDGSTDDIGETGWAGSDDGDDGRYLPAKGPAFRGDFNTTSTMLGWISPGSSASLFCIYEINNSAWTRLTFENEITPGFYAPYTHYNYVYCASGTCYGAQLWTETDLANPDETLGPITNSNHNAPNDNVCALYNFTAYDGGEDSAVFTRNAAHLGANNFSHTFWTISGDPTVYYPSVSADLDNDRDVDGQDFLTFSVCYNGSLRPPQVACANTDADLDDDGDVDGQDFLTFSVCYNGSLRRPQAACFPPNLTTCP